MTWHVHVCMFLLLLLPLQTTSTPVEHERSVMGFLIVPDPENNFTHMVVYDQETIFLGGTNYIYQVTSKNLGIEKFEKIGPNPINSAGEECHIDNSCEKNVNNTNVKVLLIYKNETESIGELIICTSLYFGTCEKRHPTTLAVTSRERPPNVVSVANSNVAFIASGPSNNRSSPTHYLYIAASSIYPGLKIAGVRLPLFSTRNITTFELLSDKSLYYVKKQYAISFNIQYIYGFSSGIYSYVISNQKSTDIGTVQIIPKLHRVCQYDKKMNSYAEATLRCFSTKSNMLIMTIQAAYIGKPGKILANSLNISPENDFLFAMFGSTVPENIGEESSLCISPMINVDYIFTHATKTCFDGRGNTGPAYVTKPQPCIQSNVSIRDDYCGEFEFNSPIDSNRVTTFTEVIKLNIRASSLTVAVTYNGDTVAFVGTQSGELKKIRIQIPNSPADEYETIKLDIGLPILKSTFLDEDKKYLLLLTPKKPLKLSEGA